MKKLGELTLQELRSKIRNRWGLIALILLICTLLQVTSVNSLCDSFEPLGSCPDYNLSLRPSQTYWNSAELSGTGLNSQVYFRYNSTTENITYVLNNKGNTSGQCYTPISSPTNIAANNTCFNIIYESNDGIGNYSKFTILKPTKLNPTFEFYFGSNNTFYHQWLASSANITYEAFVFDPSINTLYIRTRYEVWNVVNDSVTINYTITIKGKSLIVYAKSNKGKVAKYNWDSTEVPNGMPFYIFRKDNNTVDQKLTGDFMIINRSAFYRIGNILDKSDFTNYQNSGGLTFTNASKVNNQNTAYYLNLTGGYTSTEQGTVNGGVKRNNFSETFVITISNNVYDMFIYNNNTRSQYYDDLKNTWTYEYWASAGSATKEQIWNETQRLARYGLDMTNANLATYSMANSNPSRYNYSGTETQTLAFGSNITSLGIDLYYYNSLQDMEPGDAFNFNNDSYQGVPLSGRNYSYLSLNTFGANITSFGSDFHIAYDRRQDILSKVYIPNATRWHTTGLYLDTEGANLLHDSFYDAKFGNNESAKRRLQIIFQKRYTDYAKSQGFKIYTENHGALYTAGNLDLGEAGTACCTNNANRGILPSAYISEITEDMVVTDDYLRRCMIGWADDNKHKFLTGNTSGSDDVSFQRCQVRAVLQRATPHLDGFTADLHNISDNITISMYYLRYPLAKKMYEGSLSLEQFYDLSTGKWLDTSRAAIEGYDFNKALIHLKYSNGLHIYANYNNSPTWLNISINGAIRKIAPNGFYAYTENGAFEEFYNDNNLSHWVKNPEYIYVYPKTSSVTISGLGNSYYEPYAFYGDQQTNGLRSLGIVGQTTNYTATQPVLLYQRTYSESQSDLAELTTAGHFCANIFKGFELIIIAILVSIAIALVFIIKNMGGEVGGLPQLFILAILAAVMAIVAIMIVGNIGGGYCG